MSPSEPTKPAEATKPTLDFSAHVGRTAPPTRSRHPVNEPMIAHFCDAMGDANPCYVDPDFASRSVHGGIVAPPALLDVWDRPGLLFTRDGKSARTKVLDEMSEAGYDSIVAVNTELEFVRYVRPGEWLSNVETLDDVSPEKRTARGPGHFVTSRHRYTNERGDHVGNVMFRMLVFRPERAETMASANRDDVAAATPDPDPALRPVPAVNMDNQFFWDGVRRRELRIQRCNGCEQLLSPPGPRCPHCGSFDLGWVAASGHGRLYSFAVPEYPKAAGFGYPLVVALVELEGTRTVANLVGITREQLQIGMPLELCWLDAGPYPLPQFRAPRPVRRTSTLAIEDLAVGDRLPLVSLPITTTLVVSGALATRDYTAVHHDRDEAQAQGSTDVFLNINTSVGLLQRVVSDWAGPEALYRSMRVRLGAPGYPGDLLTFSGAVTERDLASGHVTIGIKAADSYGDHAIATVELTLPGSGA
jgi:uncharacterized OB-fold protein/acyl dehydratase